MPQRWLRYRGVDDDAKGNGRKGPRKQLAVDGAGGQDRERPPVAKVNPAGVQVDDGVLSVNMVLLPYALQHGMPAVVLVLFVGHAEPLSFPSTMRTATPPRRAGLVEELSGGLLLKRSMRHSVARPPRQLRLVCHAHTRIFSE